MTTKSDEYWKNKLSPDTYRITREKGTESPFTGKYVNNFEKGMYECIGCGQELFSSETKFHSDCGWPSFDRSLEGNIELQEDTSFGMLRTEVLCKNCGAHLGHIFADGPKETTGQRYCINSAALTFKEQQ